MSKGEEDAGGRSYRLESLASRSRKDSILEGFGVGASSSPSHTQIDAPNLKKFLRAAEKLSSDHCDVSEEAATMRLSRRC